MSYDQLYYYYWINLLEYYFRYSYNLGKLIFSSNQPKTIFYLTNNWNPRRSDFNWKLLNAENAKQLRWIVDTIEKIDFAWIKLANLGQTSEILA